MFDCLYTYIVAGQYVHGHIGFPRYVDATHFLFLAFISMERSLHIPSWFVLVLSTSTLWKTHALLKGFRHIERIDQNTVHCTIQCFRKFRLTFESMNKKRSYHGKTECFLTVWHNGSTVLAAVCNAIVHLMVSFSISFQHQDCTPSCGSQSVSMKCAS